MVVDNKRIYYFRCPNCEWRILNNQIKEITGYEDKIHFCEHCGSKLEKINLGNSDDTEETISENSNSIEYPVEIIAEDPDFQIGFFDNLTLVLSRMIYFNIRYLEKTLDKKIDNIELNWQLINLLSGALIPILQNDIEEVFLENLYGISLVDFYSNLAKLHVKVEKFHIFRQRFIVYLRWLVKQVFLLVSESWNKGSIDKFEAIIFRDLSSYDFSKIQSKIGCLETKDDTKDSEDLEASITNSFRGKLFHKARDVVFNYITKNSPKSNDFDSDTVLVELLDAIGILSSIEKIDSSKITYKNEAKERLGNKKKYLSILGKIMLNILDSTLNNSITELSNKYGVSRDFVTNTARYLQFKHKIRLNDRFPTTSARGSNSRPSNKTLEFISQFSLQFEDSELLSQLAHDIFKDLVDNPPKLRVDDLPLGYKTNVRYLAVSIIYFALRGRIYCQRHPKYKIFGVMEFIKDFFPDKTTMKLAITNTIPVIYKYLSNYQKQNITYKPRKIKEEYNFQGFKDNDKEIIMVKDPNNSFIQKIRDNLLKFSLHLPNSEIIKNLSINLLENAQNPPKVFSYQEIIERNKWFSSPRNMSVAFIFLAYKHQDSKVSESLSMTEFSDFYFPDYKDSNYSTVAFIYDYLTEDVKENLLYRPKRFYNDKQEVDFQKVKEFLKKFVGIFVEKNRDLFIKRALDLYSEAISNGFNENTIITKHPKYLAASLAYYSILEYEPIFKKGFVDKLKENGYNLRNIFYKVMKQLESHINIEHSIIIFDEENLKDFLLKTQIEYENMERIDNVVLIDLILETLKFYKDRFTDLMNDLQFISKNKKASRLLEKLANPNVFNKESNLEFFVEKFNELINNLQANDKSKQTLRILLEKFECKRRDFYQYTEKKNQKKIREQERYGKYQNYFFSHKVRVKRFLLMLGFSPFDGFDIWGNKITSKNICKIYANFHHFHYNPVGRSENDLVFIPIKPPEKFRKGDYLVREYLTHNIISGLEGNLRRDDIKVNTREKTILRLKKIEKVIEKNSKVLEDAVYSKNPKKLKELINWEEKDIQKAIDRLNDFTFSWASNIQKYIPTAEGYDYKRIEMEDVKLIIKDIMEYRTI